MAAWNGKLIVDMTSSHLENTIKLLEKQAKASCKKAHGSDWKFYLKGAYYDLKRELDKRDVSF